MKHANPSTTFMRWTAFAILIASVIFFVFADPCRSGAVEVLGIVGILLICELFRRYANVAKQATVPLSSPTKLATEQDRMVPAGKLVLETGSTTDSESTVGDLSTTCSSADSDSESETAKFDVLEWPKVGVRMAWSTCSSADSDSEADADEIDIVAWYKIGVRVARLTCIGSDSDCETEPDEPDIVERHTIGVCKAHSLHNAVTESMSTPNFERSVHGDTMSDNSSFVGDSEAELIDIHDWCAVSGRLSGLLCSVEDELHNWSDTDSWACE